jgi:YfiH family protein
VTSLYKSGGHIYDNKERPIHDNAEWQAGIDAVVTDIKEVFPIIMAADCAAVAIYDPVKKIIASVHTGLIGSVNDILTKTVKCMLNEYKSDPVHLEAVIFPSIRKCHYDLRKSGAWKRIKDDVTAHYGSDNPIYAGEMFDLQGMITNQLKAVGVKATNIFDTELCTVCSNDMFFSNLAAGNAVAKKEEGRFASIVGMKNER